MNNQDTDKYTVILDRCGELCVSFRISRSVQTRLVKGRSNVRFGSKADMCSALADVRSTPESGHVQCN